MDIHTTLEGDRYVHCAYCNNRIEVEPLDTGGVQCRLCRRPTFVNNTNLQMGQPSSSIQPSSSEAPFITTPTASDIHRFYREETALIMATDHSITPQDAEATAQKNWATKGQNWWRQQQGKQ
ncbi:hypothetical protein RHMOL_Rhmol05G0204700 [Rhododendron molle]|uniref:Uncharacterized protein n=1 Tax=Rhododendron molle TaxID=49168 RepID=A0ACC0NSP9_RHOML|nr:hypothetical protein RHMOL_Rhmol05G0204700 [Rhododendron molle]